MRTHLLLRNRHRRYSLFLVMSPDPNIIVQNTSLESVLSIVSVGRFISIATEASQGVTWPDLHFRDIHDQNGTTRLEFSVYWREDNDNPALQRFFTLINERYPV